MDAHQSEVFHLGWHILFAGCLGMLLAKATWIRGLLSYLIPTHILYIYYTLTILLLTFAA